MDPSNCFAVLVAAPTQGDAGWRAYVQTIDEVQARVPRGQRPVIVQVFRRGLDAPSPMLRRELAALRGRIRPNAINAVVAEDTSVRLIQTALDWLHRPHYESSTFADFASAQAYIEALLGRSMPMLPELYQRAAAELR